MVNYHVRVFSSSPIAVLAPWSAVAEAALLQQLEASTPPSLLQQPHTRQTNGDKEPCLVVVPVNLYPNYIFSVSFELDEWWSVMYAHYRLVGRQTTYNTLAKSTWTSYNSIDDMK